MLTNVKKHLEWVNNNPKLKLKIINAFSNIFDLAINPITDETLSKLTQIVAIDKYVICCALPKTDFGKKILRLFIEDENADKIKVPKWEARESGKSKISLEFLNKVLNALKTYDEAVEIETAKNYLIKIENDDFQFMIAPRVEYE